MDIGSRACLDLDKSECEDGSTSQVVQELSLYACALILSSVHECRTQDIVRD